MLNGEESELRFLNITNPKVSDRAPLADLASGSERDAVGVVRDCFFRNGDRLVAIVLIFRSFHPCYCTIRSSKLGDSSLGLFGIILEILFGIALELIMKFYPILSLPSLSFRQEIPNWCVSIFPYKNRLIS